MARNPFGRKKGDATFRKKFMGAIEGDALRAVHVIKSSYKSYEWNPRDSAGKDVTSVVFRTKQGAVWATEKELARPNASVDEIQAHVNRFRSKTTGRVSRGGHSGDKRIGRWKFIDRMHVDAARFNRYLRAASKRVGKLQAGWNPMIRAFRGAPAAAWISRHPGRGTARSTIRPDGSGFGEGVNRVPYASRFYTPGRLAQSARVRERHMKHLLRMKTDKVVDLFNRMRAKGRI